MQRRTGLHQALPVPPVYRHGSEPVKHRLAWQNVEALTVGIKDDDGLPTVQLALDLSHAGRQTHFLFTVVGSVTGDEVDQHGVQRIGFKFAMGDNERVHVKVADFHRGEDTIMIESYLARLRDSSVSLRVGAFLTLAVGASPVCATDPLNAYPPPAPGEARYVLNLPAQPDENRLQVELIVGQPAQVDDYNQFHYTGTIEALDIPGWGYTRYRVATLGPMIGTRMFRQDGHQAVTRFITLGGAPYLVRYNSLLPLVVYVPAGAEVRYRLWRADPDTPALNRG